MENIKLEVKVLNTEKGPLSGYDEVSRTNIGQATYSFVWRMMRSPEARAKIQARAAQIRAAGL